ncbi:MAG: hypothetical protein COZ06_31400 [Armatimonadetes bacterium CG_4_10_14_3_um_filter_66_18]|nr:MAG: hypothetical protein AUJ96_00820 [Armatimonadetes bacterium CG2_30_66_41]PIU92489.1 MAG: hypothetical protein COS65_17645 [Armatimonadetes bacterium CG06_land_8_20_14_3_00_66_21]PIX49259.1 MAG: hypothetical protein COZ57_03880 [Armatimonadetes bacterium CG_4_8_14_3_um_filter_66_20]PIY38300.1 MAG: hypothetical protein COZ06_31400 [Armatimonadetes bacterium CG_4_10_14_3_um_filter_66_18]PIZ31728.1 MAG: hypothetical protein COY42_32205 [Armatimonadetes bacterium CG_4_10_14_0_8_um_filter_66_
MSREEVRQQLIAAVREGYYNSRNVASLSRALGYQLAPPPEPHKAWAATNSMVKELADALGDIIEENNRRVEAALEERLKSQ